MENIVTLKYTHECEELWDDFVKNGVLGTIYHTRKFINYHPNNRFTDNSILLFKEDELICVVPACKKKQVIPGTTYNSDGDIIIDPDEFSTFNQKASTPYFSYLGATYGGPVFLKKYFQTRYVSIMIDKIMQYYNNEIEFRLANNIYFEDNIFMVYSLLGAKLRMIPEMSWYIKTNDEFIDNIQNKRNRSNLIKAIEDPSILCYKTLDDNKYKLFYSILEKNLSDNHMSIPTHTLHELLLLKSILENNASLYIVEKDETMLGGVYVVKVTSVCWYTFYISRNIDINNSSLAIPYLMYTIANDAKKEGVKYLDYGITTEDRGKILNSGLADFKERSLGGTANSRFLFVK